MAFTKEENFEVERGSDGCETNDGAQRREQGEGETMAKDYSSAEEATLEIDVGNTQGVKDSDDDGRVSRTGTLTTATAHIVTAVIGSGVLSLAWAIAQLGWIAGPLGLMAFSLITCFCSALLVDCYRSPDPIKGKRNHTYTIAVKNILGGWNFKLCGIAQYAILLGVSIGFIITTAISMSAVSRSNCFHKNGHKASCSAPTNKNMIIYGVIQIVLSQIPNFHKLWWLSVVAAIMSFFYSSLGLGLSIARIATGAHARTTLTGVTVGVDVSGSEKIWRTLQALGNIAFAYSFSSVLIEIEDTLKSSPPENQVMRKASFIGVSITTVFYMACGVLGYAAFGNGAPGNILTGFGFYNPFWLIDVGNICIVIHLIGAYQVVCQPIYEFVERIVRIRYPENSFITSEYTVTIPFFGKYPLNLFRIMFRTSYVIVTTVVAMIFPFFNEFVGLVGALAFWPLTVYFPVEMYMTKAKIKKFSLQWMWLQLLSMVCLLVSIGAVCGSVQGLVHAVAHYKPFKQT